MAQNYHIFTPAVGKDWAMAFGCEPWVKEMPYANHAATYKFKQGESGKYVMEFWITPFDYAGCEGPQRAVESKLEENKIIGVAWGVIDYDGPAERSDGFWNLSSQHNMFGNATLLRAFRLMPLEPQFMNNDIQAKWSFKVLDMNRRLVAFQDASDGQVMSWKWDFGDGTTSTEQHPLHSYKAAGQYIVVLYVEGPTGKSRMSKIYDVTLR
jgi:chitodextrinase